MIDHLFSAVLTFALLAGGTLAVGSELFETPTRAPAPTAAARATTVVQLPTVVVVAKRGATAQAVASATTRD